MDESSFLTALMTAVCRASLWLAPAVIFHAAQLSGSGTGKGKLARAICLLAFGRTPSAVTLGETREETEKRISSALIEGAPALLFDNLNDCSFSSQILESALTERPASVRVLGASKLVPLCSSALVVLNGNGLSPSIDMSRRSLKINFDARVEDASARDFRVKDFLAEVMHRRVELLAKALTIWRWGRKEGKELAAGKTLGSFEQWGRWARDPLLALGCQDAVEQISEDKKRDPARIHVKEIFEAWWECHRNHDVILSKLDAKVTELIDPKSHGRQYVLARISKLVGTRLAGFQLTSEVYQAKWTPTTYALQSTAVPRSKKEAL